MIKLSNAFLAETLYLSKQFNPQKQKNIVNMIQKNKIAEEINFEI